MFLSNTPIDYMIYKCNIYYSDKSSYFTNVTTIAGPMCGLEPAAGIWLNGSVINPLKQQQSSASHRSWEHSAKPTLHRSKQAEHAGRKLSIQSSSSFMYSFSKKNKQSVTTYSKVYWICKLTFFQQFLGCFKTE